MSDGKPTISERALGIREVPEKDRPVSEVFRLQGEAWAEAAHDALINKLLKDTFFERLRQSIYDEQIEAGNKISMNEAGRIATMSSEYEGYLRNLAAKKLEEDRAWVKRKSVEFGFDDLQNRDANARRERDIGRRGS